jgi:hypothetical protein
VGDHQAAATNGVLQDKGHLFNLERTKSDFETCFPQTSIDVAVGYHDGMPHRVVVKRTTPTNGTTRLVYEKDYYHASQSYAKAATCTKFMPDGSVWIKASDFDTPGTFKRVSSDAMASAGSARH